MSSAASLSLLKGGKKAVEEELKAPATEPKAEEAEAEPVVDVDDLNSAQLDALVKEHEIETPEEWGGWKAPEKRAWLKTQFEEVPTETAPAAKAPEPKTETEAAPAAKAEKKTAAKSKAVAKSTVKTGEVENVGEDILSDLIHEIENMKEKEAKSAVSALAEQTEVTFFKLGGVLSVIQANGWFEPYGSFKDYVEKEHGILYRKATYWISIYNSLSEAKVPWAKVAALGWTKLKEIADVLTLENVDEWVEIAKGQSTLQLIETVKASKAKDAPKALEELTSKTVTTKTFKVHEDQKTTIDTAIAKARTDAGTDHDVVALEFICLDYIGGQTMAQKLKKLGLEGACAALETAFPGTNFSVEVGEQQKEDAA